MTVRGPTDQPDFKDLVIGPAVATISAEKSFSTTLPINTAGQCLITIKLKTADGEYVVDFPLTVRPDDPVNWGVIEIMGIVIASAI